MNYDIDEFLEISYLNVFTKDVRGNTAPYWSFSHPKALLNAEINLDVIQSFFNIYDDFNSLVNCLKLLGKEEQKNAYLVLLFLSERCKTLKKSNTVGLEYKFNKVLRNIKKTGLENLLTKLDKNEYQALQDEFNLHLNTKTLIGIPDPLDLYIIPRFKNTPEMIEVLNSLILNSLFAKKYLLQPAAHESIPMNIEI